MSGKRRKSNSEITISLFSFQDIITCLSGIMILLVLLIAVDIVTEQLPERSNSVQNMNSNSEQINNSVQEINNGSFKNLEQKIQRLQKEQHQFEEELSDDQLRIKELNKQFHQLKKKYQSIYKNTNVISFIPAKNSKSNQRAILIECSGDFIHSENFIQSAMTDDAVGVNVARFKTDPNGITKFLKSLEHLNKSKNYLMFIIKPSASKYAMQLVQQVQMMGFDVGYDAMVEEELVDFEHKSQ